MDESELLLSPRRKETCPFFSEITINSNAVCQILEKLDKIENRLDLHADRAEEQLTKIIEFIDKKYVTKDSFSPVQKIVYGLVGAILLAVVGALVALVLK
jgi:hypothetical protein